MPVKGPTPWVSRIVVVPKSTPGEVRITQDWRDVNAHVEREIQPIPIFEEATDEMGGSTIWSKLDMFKSFHQICIASKFQKVRYFFHTKGSPQMYHSGNGIHQRFRNPPTSNEHGIVRYARCKMDSR